MQQPQELQRVYSKSLVHLSHQSSSSAANPEIAANPETAANKDLRAEKALANSGLSNKGISLSQATRGLKENGFCFGTARRFQGAGVVSLQFPGLSLIVIKWLP